MKVALLSVADNGGGAARSAYRLHQGLQLQKEVLVCMLVQSKLTDDFTVFGLEGKISKGLAQLRPFLNSLPLKCYRNCDSTTYSIQWLPDNLGSRVHAIDPDIINLHWICDGFLRIETLCQFRKPMVWTLHDMWPFTGGCHYSGECEGFLQHCGTCPQLGSKQTKDLSMQVWKRKSKAFQGINLTIVTPSQWLADCAQASTLFQRQRIEVIPYGLDTQLFKPVSKFLARQILNLPQDKQLILFGAIQATNDRRKGFHLLQSALQRLRYLTQPKDIHLAIMGASSPLQPLDLGFQTHYLGTLKDDYALVLAYAAADVFVAPSEQDNLPNTILEAIACGTPCVAFDIGGMPDMIEHQKNGYLARPFDTEDFAQGICWILEDRDRWQILSQSARSRAEQTFPLTLQARRYRDLFNEVLESSHSRINH